MFICSIEFMMWVWVVSCFGFIDSELLEEVELFDFVVGLGEVCVVVVVCGVCCMDFYFVEGDFIFWWGCIVFGYEVVGVVDEVGEGCVWF